MLAGVVIHPYFDGAYANTPKIIEALKYLGVQCVRDNVPNPAYGNQDHYDQIRDAIPGLLWSFAVASIADVEHVLAKFPAGPLLQFEGPNEPNNFGWGEAGADPDAFIRKLKGYGVKVAGICSEPPVSTPSADYANEHPYPRGGNVSLQHWIDECIQREALANPGKPLIFTEFGYTTVENNWFGQVTEEQQAVRIVEALDLMKVRGVQQAYIYTLVDHFPSWGLGLYRNDWTPKPAAHAVRDWIARQQVTVPTPSPPTPTLPVEEIRARLVKARTEANDTKNRAARSVYAIDKAIEILG